MNQPFVGASKHSGRPKVVSYPPKIFFHWPDRFSQVYPPLIVRRARSAVIRIELNPTRIERVVIEARSEMERDFDTATYVLIHPILRRINRELKRQIERTQRSNEL